MNSFRGILSVLLILVLAWDCSPVSGNIRPQNGPLAKNRQRVICGADTLLVYQDCKMCVCTKAHQPATCLRKSCDLRTKDGGMCPPAFLKLDDAAICQGRPNNSGSCRTDNDCPGNLFCCFDFCEGAKCVHPVPMEGMKSHPGRGYPA